MGRRKAIRASPDQLGDYLLLVNKIVYTLKFVSESELPKGWVGSCDGPHIPNPKIKISRKIQRRNKLVKIIHEVLHALDWSKDDEWVVEASEIIGEVLWELGWRE